MLGTIALKYLNKRIWLLLLTSFFYIISSIAQERDDISVQYTHYNKEDGLPSEAINCTFHSSDGFLWIGTNYGFSRFDGENFVNYLPHDFDISFGSIDRICEDKNGNLWFSERLYVPNPSRKGILCFNPKLETLNRFPEPLTDSEYYVSISCTPEKKIALATNKGQLIEVDTNGQRVIYAFEDQRSLIQIDANRGYYWLNSGKRITLINTNGEFVREWTSSADFVFVGQKGEDMYVKDNFQLSGNSQKYRILLLKTESSDTEILAVTKDNNSLSVYDRWKYLPSQETFLVDYMSGGISLIEETGGEFSKIDFIKNNENSTNINDVYLCKGGFFWFSTPSGLNQVKFTPSKFQAYLTKGTADYSMRSLFPLGDSLFCGQYFCNIIYDLNKNKIVDKFPLDELSVALSIIRSRNGCLYLGGYGMVLKQLCGEDMEETLYYHDTQKTTERIENYWTLLEDSKGEIWVGTNQGLSFLDEENGVLSRFDVYNQFTNLSEALVFDIVETENAYWIATQKGLFKMESEKGITGWFHSGEPTIDSKYLPTNVIYDIHEDADGFLWLTTFGSGLIRFNPQDGTYKQITVKEGLAHNVTNDILEDDFNNLWISTNKGIVCLNRKTGDFVNFDKSHGLHVDEFNKKSSTKLNDGRLVFGSLDGFVTFRPEDFFKDTVKSVINPLRITQLIIGDTIRKSFDFAHPITLADRKTDITLDLRVLDFENDEVANYEWKWKGEAEFTSLPSFQLHLSELPMGESTIVFRAQTANGTFAANELEVQFLTPSLFSWKEIFAGLICLCTLYYLLFIRKSDKKEKTYAIEDESKEKENTYEIVESKIKTIQLEQPKIAEESHQKILKPIDQKWLDNLTQKIENIENIGRFSVEDMASEVNLSSRQLNRKIKQLTGITPNQFLRDIKLKKSKRLLEEGAVATVAEASFAVGFEKPDYFSRLFQEKYGRRPVTYFDKKKK